ncbi:MAG: hypothetical protein WC584_04395 [Candidatus Pacearchaeota archaeon]
MGINVEFNPDLALRKYGTVGRKEEECLPERLEEGRAYKFLKEGQRNYWLDGELPLLETEGEQRLSRPMASITILEATHFRRKEKLYTKGKYLVNEVFDITNPKINFESYKRI